MQGHIVISGWSRRTTGPLQKVTGTRDDITFAVVEQANHDNFHDCLVLCTGRSVPPDRLCSEKIALRVVHEAQRDAADQVGATRTQEL